MVVDITIDFSDFIIYQSLDGAVNTDKIYKQIFNKKSICTCLVKNDRKLKFYSSKFDHCLDCDFQKDLVVVLFYRLGLHKPEPGALKVLGELVRLPFFSGGFGGKGNQAYFILGAVDNQYIYMDPHFVQVG